MFQKKSKLIQKIYHEQKSIFCIKRISVLKKCFLFVRFQYGLPHIVTNLNYCINILFILIVIFFINEASALLTSL